MKKIFTILLVLAGTLPVAAQHILIDKSGSNNEVVNISDLRQITFDGTTVTVEQNDGTASSNDMSVINRISFGDYTAIGQVKPDDGALVTYISSDKIAVNGYAGSQVTIYNIVGSQVLNTRLSADYGTISIAGLPKGIYIVKTNDRTAKIIRR
ncbi:MAG: T9SS type A sorting domain-containing protein [Bacteroidaceae bacterium]|nr:T9SS type A sorting domain-containing protein [Bacteroidaceae bacterium]